MHSCVITTQLYISNHPIKKPVPFGSHTLCPESPSALVGPMILRYLPVEDMVDMEALVFFFFFLSPLPTPRARGNTIDYSSDLPIQAFLLRSK